MANEASTRFGPRQSDSVWHIERLSAVNPDQMIAMRGQNGRRYSGLLQSAAAAERPLQGQSVKATAQWSILLISDDSLDAERIDCCQISDSSFLSQLDHALASQPKTQQPLCAETGQALPFASGWQLFLGYELAAQVEPVLSAQLVFDNSVIAQARRVCGAVLYHHQQQQAWLCLELTQLGLLDCIQADMAEATNRLKERVPARPVQIEQVLEDEPERFTQAVTKALRYLYDGDVFQTNLSRNWQIVLSEQSPQKQAPKQPSERLYRQLTENNPAPFAAWLDVLDAENTVGFELISSSPERLIAINKLENGHQRWVQTRPIAGTRPRDEVFEQNAENLAELRSSPKENAEHLMLIDLERNDLGRVCVPGTIEVDELMSIESFAHVHHIVSNIRGQLRDEVTVGQAIAAVFPGGTITGCPKVRCMQVIAELEQCCRSAYTGAVGYLGLDGQLDLNIVIRSLQRRYDKPMQLSLRAGAGIVADSQPEKELAETRAKAASVLRAFE